MRSLAHAAGSVAPPAVTLAAQVVPSVRLDRPDATFAEPMSSLRGLRELSDGRVVDRKGNMYYDLSGIFAPGTPDIAAGGRAPPMRWRPRVFDGQGRLVEQVDRADGGRLVGFGNGVLYAVRTYADDPECWERYLR